MITTLEFNHIFVFGSNTAGRHGRGAALQAYKQFGAVYGVGEGLTGQCYAFPTLDIDLKQRSHIQLYRSAGKLYECAVMYPELTFLLTKVGCGLAGFTEDYMKKFFKYHPSNVVRPEGW